MVLVMANKMHYQSNIGLRNHIELHSTMVMEEKVEE